MEHLEPKTTQQPKHAERQPASTDSVSLLNQIGDDVWQVMIEGNTEPDAKPLPLDFTAMKNLHKRQVLQESMLYAITRGMGWADKANRIVATSEGQSRHMLLAAHDIYEAWTTGYDGLSLRSLSEVDVVRLLRTILESNCADTGVPVRSRLLFMGRLLNATTKYFAKGLASDGCLHRVAVATQRAAVEPLLAPHNITFEDWRRGGTYGGIPIDVALVWFMEASEVIHARDTKILLAYFAAWRASPPKSSTFTASINALKQYRAFQKNGRWGRGISKANCSAISAFGNAFDDHTEEAGIGVIKALPWNTWQELTGYCRQVRDAGTAILHLVAGNRVHEVAWYRTDQWTLENGKWWYRSAESKSNKGGLADRSMDAIGADVVDILTHMSYLDPDIPRPVVGETFVAGAMQHARMQRGLAYREIAIAGWSDGRVQRHFNTATVGQNFTSFYQSHLVEKHPELGKKHPNAHPHQARHFFADIALHWLDPRYVDVIVRLREHYRHKDDGMIYAYTNGKRSDDIQGEAARRYLLEALKRIVARDPADPWFGAAIKRIRKEVGDISVLTPDELSELCDGLAEEYSRFVVWEWGFCMVRHGEESTANCADSESGIPNLIATDREKAPELCGGCPHQGAHLGFKDNIRRIGISCQSRGKAFEDLNRPFMAKRLGYEPAKHAERLLKEMTA